MLTERDHDRMVTVRNERGDDFGIFAVTTSDLWASPGVANGETGAT